MRNIRAIAFDLDNTLWDVGPVIARAEARMMAWLKEQCPRITERVTPEEMRAARAALAISEPDKAHDLVYLRLETLTRVACASGYGQEHAQQAFKIFEHFRNDVEVFPDVAPALQVLSRRHRLASLSNGTADLTRIGLAHYFSVRLNAGLIGVAKPNKRCFERLAQELDLPPEAILYVGDDPLLDVDAARDAGLWTAWMNRKNEIWPPEVRAADLVITDCGALSKKLE